MIPFNEEDKIGPWQEKQEVKMKAFYFKEGLMSSSVENENKIKVEQATPEKIKRLKTSEWDIWSCEASEFDWEYDEPEACHILEGEVTVSCDDGETVSFKGGDLVQFPKGLSCRWKVTKPVRKHYIFEEKL